MTRHTADLVKHYPMLLPVAQEIDEAITTLIDCYRSGGKLLLCGNGGSAADCGHIVGELMKGFLKHRPTGSDDEVIARLQGGLPAISLCESAAIFTAFCNDVDPDLVFAQQVYGLGREGDVLMGITTSGNSSNVLKAMDVARKLGMKTLSLTGGSGGHIRGLSHVCIVAPEQETYRVQELHLPIYHCICAAVEEAFFAV